MLLSPAAAAGPPGLAVPSPPPSPCLWFDAYLVSYRVVPPCPAVLPPAIPACPAPPPRRLPSALWCCSPMCSGSTRRRPRGRPRSWPSRGTKRWCPTFIGRSKNGGTADCCMCPSLWTEDLNNDGSWFVRTGAGSSVCTAPAEKRSCRCWGYLLR